MWRSPEPRYDVASGLSQGGRDYQEDALVTDFPFGMDSGIAVLADGMGGHEAGDVASKIVVTEVFSELKFSSATFGEDEQAIPQRLARATAAANTTIKDHVTEHKSTYGMGATLVSVVMVENRMYWMSVGDSPLYILRDGKLKQLNEDHSMSPQIDFMVKQGLLTEEMGRDHPDRHCLTSVIIGGRIPKADCPLKPYELKMGDVVVVSSDGLQYLGEDKIQKVVHRYRRRKSAEIAGYLLEAVNTLNHPEQDNVSFSVIKLNHMKPVVRKIVSKPIGAARDESAGMSRVIPMTPIATEPEKPSDDETPEAKEAKEVETKLEVDDTANVDIVPDADITPEVEAGDVPGIDDFEPQKRAVGAL